MSATCPKYVFECKQGHAIEYCHSNNSSLLCQLNFINAKDCHKVEVNLTTPSVGDITGLKTVSICLSN